MTMALKSTKLYLQSLKVLSRSSSVLCLQNVLEGFAHKQQAALQKATPITSARCFSTSRPFQDSNRQKILARSTVLLQDGLDIRELPIVMKRMSVIEYSFLSNIPPDDVEIKVATEQDEMFKVRMQGCNTMQQVFSLLEVPGNEVSSYAAAFALQRLWELSEGGIESADLFIQKAVLNELCETALRDLHKLKTETVINLIRCYCFSSQPSNYPKRFVEALNMDVEQRIGNNQLTILELCSLLDALSQCPHSDSEFVGNLWIHLGNRYREVDENSLAKVYSVLQYIPTEYRYLFDVTDKQLLKCWWKLNTADIMTVCMSLIISHHDNYAVFNNIGRWCFLHVHDLSCENMKKLLMVYSHFSVFNEYFIRALERFVDAKRAKLENTVTVMAVNYCRKQRYLSSRILNTASYHFEMHGETYSAIEAYLLLRAYGQLNFVPSNAARLFAVIEQVLSDKFNQFEAHTMVELLASFVYIERFPVNFVDRVFTPPFFSKIRSANHTSRQNARRHVLELRTALKMEMLQQQSLFLQSSAYSSVSSILKGRWYHFHEKVGKHLATIIDEAYLKEGFFPRSTPHFIDYEIALDENGKAIDSTKNKVHKRLAILTVMPEHCCVNTKHLMGEFAMKQRHLQQLNYEVLQVHYNEFMWKENKLKLVNQLKEHISGIGS